MLVRSTRLESLASPAFMAALALLVLNDFVLKPLFHNALTGKLSDFAGLFALTLFVANLWPSHRRVGAWAIIAAFAFWKTSYADSLIALLSSVSPVAFVRTVDLTDLVALPMVPLAAWVAPKLKPWPLPRALQVGLAALAPLAFTATSSMPQTVRSTLDVSTVVVADEAVLQAFFDEVALEHGLRCFECDALGEGRVYSRDYSLEGGPSDLTVNLDVERRQVFYTTSGHGRKGRENVRQLSEDIRAGIQQQFPGVTAIEFSEDRDPLEEHSTTFAIELPTTGALSVETAEQAKRMLSEIVEDVVRTHGLRADDEALVYYAGRRFGASAYDRDLILTPFSMTNSRLRVRVARQTENYAVQYAAINEDLAVRLAAAFGSTAVTREDFGSD